MLDNLMKKPGLKWLALSVLTIVLVIISLVSWRYIASHPSTDDAYVQANIINIAPQISGPVAATFVNDNQYVKKGTILFTIDPKPYELAVANAAAKLEVVEKKAKRIVTLAKQGSASQEQSDELQAELTMAKTASQQAQLNLAYTQVVAPADGYITNYKLRTGTMLQAGNPVFALVENNTWWVDANYKETQLERIRPGQTATIELDMYQKPVFKGIVESISSGSGSTFSLLPPENATGNWVKVTQRFQVKIKITDVPANYRLRVGSSASVTIKAV